MLLEIFGIVTIIGIFIVLLSFAVGEKWFLYTGFALWFIGLCGIIIVSLLNKGPEIQEPCRCEVCCKHRND